MSIHDTVQRIDPDWVMLGVDVRGGQYQGFHGVIIYASNELDSFELNTVIDDPEPLDLGRGMSYRDVSRLRYVDLRGRAKTYVVAMGADYAEAVRSLFSAWNPGAVT